MATRNDLFPSKYLKHADLGGAEVTLTINSVLVEEVGMDKDKKPVMNFSDDEKFLVLNLTNYETIAAAYGEETAAWRGKKVTLYGDRAQFAGKIVPCIRIRPPVNTDLPLAAPAR